MTPKRINFLSPAAVALAVAGTTQTQVAEAMGVTQAAVSQWFTGRRGAPPELASTLEELLGPDKAAEVLEALPKPERAAA